MGERAKSKVTGFEGIVTGTHKYLYGSPQTTLTSTSLDFRGTTVAETFDDDELVSANYPDYPLEESTERPAEELSN